MKRKLRYLAAISMLLMTISVVAQPTITSSGVNPYTGISYTNNMCDHISEGNSGANQTWNLSSMVATQSQQITIDAASNTTHGSSFPGATQAWISNSSSGEISYYNASSTALQFYGVDIPGYVTMPYSDPEDQLRFPMTYNDSYTDSWNTSFYSSGYTYYRKGTTTVTADAYGTVITPDGTYNNTLRVHLHQVYTDSTNISGSPYMLNYTADIYIWYKEGYKSAIASTHTLTSSTGTQQGSIYASNPPVSTQEHISNNNIEVYPNPASEFVKIDFSELSPDAEITLLNNAGQTVKTAVKKQQNSIELDISGLSQGLYFARITNGNSGIILRKIMIRK